MNKIKQWFTGISVFFGSCLFQTLQLIFVALTVMYLFHEAIRFIAGGFIFKGIMLMILIPVLGILAVQISFIVAILAILSLIIFFFMWILGMTFHFPFHFQHLFTGSYPLLYPTIMVIIVASAIIWGLTSIWGFLTAKNSDSDHISIR